MKLRYIKERILGGTYFSGPYANWMAAKKECDGYDSTKLIDAIVNKSKVARSKGLYERDGFIIENPKYDFALLTLIADLLYKNEKIRVVDFGGGCGTTYFNNKIFLEKYENRIEWIVVEQPYMVEQTQNHFFPVKFEASFPKACDGVLDIIFFSGSIQYLEDVDHILEQANLSKAVYCIIERIPLHSENQKGKLVYRQSVSRKLDDKSYPLWIMTREILVSSLTNYELLDMTPSSLESVPCQNLNVVFNSLIFKRGRLP